MTELTRDEVNRYCHERIMQPRMRTRPASPMPLRFWEKAALTADATRCWLWTAYCDKNGRGRFGFGKQSLTASVVAFVLANNRNPIGHVRHTCDVPACVNPNHLLEGSHWDNMQDRQERGRTARGSKITRAVLTEAKAAVIKTRIQNGERYVAIAKDYSIDASVISKIRHGKLWKHVEAWEAREDGK